MRINTSIYSFFKNDWFKKYGPYGLFFALGFILRAIRMLNIHPVIFDEAGRFIAIIEYPLGDLFRLGHLASNVHDAFGFLLIIKAFIGLFGYSELAIRLFPFISGIISLLLMIRLCSLLVNQRAGLIAFGLFCVAPYSVMYAATLKPYATDILLAIMLYLLFLGIYSFGLNKGRDLVLYAMTGAVALWISQPAIFIISGSGLAVFILLAQSRRKLDMVKFCGVMVFWFLNFYILYQFSYKPFVYNEPLVGEWAPFLGPQQFSLMVYIKWLISCFYGVFLKPVVIFPIVGIPLFIGGGISLFNNNRPKSMIILFPLLTTILAASLRKYPLGDRALMYLMPMFCLVLAQGWESFLNEDRARIKIMSLLVTIVLFWAPLRECRDVIKFRREGGKPAIQYILKYFKEDDIICVSASAYREFVYYKYLYKIPSKNFIKVPVDPDYVYFQELEVKLNRYDRVWLFAHYAYLFRDVYLYHVFDAWGEEKKKFQSSWCRAILYDLKKTDSLEY